MMYDNNEGMAAVIDPEDGNSLEHDFMLDVLSQLLEFDPLKMRRKCKAEIDKIEIIRMRNFLPF